MPTVQASLAQTGIPARYQEKGVFAVVSTYQASALQIGDVVEMMKVQSGVTVVGGALIFEALGASTTLSVGDGGGVADLLAATSTSSAGTAQILSGGKFPKKYTADDTIDIKLAGGAATGKITLIVFMTAEEVDLV